MSAEAFAAKRYEYGRLRILMWQGMAMLLGSGALGLAKALGHPLGNEIHWAPAIYGFFLALILAEASHFTPQELGSRRKGEADPKVFAPPILASVALLAAGQQLAGAAVAILISLAALIAALRSLVSRGSGVSEDALAQARALAAVLSISTASLAAWAILKILGFGARLDMASLTLVLAASTPYLARFSSKVLGGASAAVPALLVAAAAAIQIPRLAVWAGVVAAALATILMVSSLIGISRASKDLGELAPVLRICAASSAAWLVVSTLPIMLSSSATWTTLDLYVHMLVLGHGISSLYMGEALTLWSRLASPRPGASSPAGYTLSLALLAPGVLLRILWTFYTERLLALGSAAFLLASPSIFFYTHYRKRLRTLKEHG